MSLLTMKIVQSPDPALLEVCEPCQTGDKALVKLGKKMAQAMYKNGGCGLAAPQVGILKRFVVIDCNDPEAEPDPLFLVNPEIVETWGKQVEDLEGCLSLPGISVPMTRPEWARVRYWDLDGNEQVVESDGLLGRCLQHEIDHLNGKTLLESCAPKHRLKAISDYQAARAAGARPGEVG